VPRRKPSYLLHKSTGQARVRINGQDHYLGTYGSPESRARYAELVEAWFEGSGGVARRQLTIDGLCVLYMQHAQKHYRKNGRQTDEVNNIRVALRHVVAGFGTMRARDFGPKALKLTREAMIKAGCVRTSINRMISRIKGMFRWAVAEELIPPENLVALQALTGLRYGRTEARESAPVLPVPTEDIEAIQPFVSRQVWAMIQLQILTGARPGEIVIMRGADLNRQASTWEYRPRSHKTEHHHRSRVIFLGPRAQELVSGFLKADPEAYLFSPADAERERDAERRRNRQTPMTPSQRARRPLRRPRRTPGQYYRVSAYGQAIRKACETAFEMPQELRNVSQSLPVNQQKNLRERARQWRKDHCWHPHQLRHNAGTELRRHFGIEAARVVLGHASAVTTEIYAERDESRAREIMSKIG